MQIFLYISLLLFSIGGVFSLIRQAQMLQQNSYFLSRYAKWLKEESSFKKIFLLLPLIIAVLFLLVKWYIPLMILAIICCAIKIPYARYKQKTSIKPLVFTGRVKRQFATAIILLVLFGVLGCIFNITILNIISIALSFIPCLTISLALIVNTPMEKSFSRYYINDAKKMLKKHLGTLCIGITGSYGKTSTKYILATLLGEKFNVLYTPASFNTPLGVVRTIREKLRPDTQIFIAEMGAKKKGDIKEICNIVHPKMGIITSVGPQHLDTFGNIETVVSTKFELAESIKKQGGDIFLNTDNELIKENAPENHISYGKCGDFKYDNVSYSRNGTEFDIIYGNESIHIKTKLLGLHNVLNITAAAAVAIKLGVSEKEIRFAASKLAPVSHRLEMKSFIKGSVLLDDAYNANPIGSIEAVNILGCFDGMKKVIVTPGLVELGDKEYECNYNLGAAAAKVCDTIILVGKQRSIPLNDGAEKENFKGELKVVSSFKEAMTILTEIADKDTVVLFENDLPDNYSK